jgi:hypothetical protein
MSQTASAHDPWADPPDPIPRRRRREADSWASAEDLEVLGTIGGREPGTRRAGGRTAADGDTADWMVLTLERDPETTGIALVDDEPHDEIADERPAVEIPAGAPRARRPLRAVQAPPVHAQAPVDELAPVDAPRPAAAGTARARAAAAEGERRTVVIRGQAGAPAQRPTAGERGRPARRPSERVAHRPDRVALWAFGLGLLLILVAILSAAGA